MWEDAWLLLDLGQPRADYQLTDITTVHLKFLVRMSNGSVVRVLTDTNTDTQTDGTDFITSTADAGGKISQLITLDK